MAHIVENAPAALSGWELNITDMAALDTMDEGHCYYWCPIATGLTCRSGGDDGEPLSVADRDALSVRLGVAAERGDVPGMQRALAAGAEVNWSNAECWHWTALHEASCNGKVAAVAWLIANGADIELLGKRNQTALHIASDAGEDEVVEMLLAHGANVHAIDAHAETPLSLADNDETRTLLKAALIRVRKEG